MGSHDTSSDRLNLHLRSAPEAVRDALDAITTALAGRGLRPGVRGTIELVVAESLNNVVEHAYGDSETGDIVLRMTLLPGAVEVMIEDRGRRLPGNALPDPDPHDLDVTRANLPEGGFGWCMIRSLTSRLVYTRKDGCNQLLLRFDLDQLDQLG